MSDLDGLPVTLSADMQKFLSVPPPMPEGYSKWRGEFSKALDPLFYSIGYLDGLVWSGRGFFFENGKAAAVAEIRVYPTGARDVHGLIAAGELPAIVMLIDDIEDWAKRHGCIGAVIESREGWVRVLKHKGYGLHQQTVRKVL